MREEQLDDLKNSGESTTQLVIDGKITNLEDLYQYSQKIDSMDPDRAREERPFLDKWSGQVGNMSLKEVTKVTFNVGVNQLILVSVLGLGVDKITVSDVLSTISNEPNYKIVQRDFWNYMKHFLPPGE
jgi:hypothetical protein